MKPFPLLVLAALFTLPVIAQVPPPTASAPKPASLIAVETARTTAPDLERVRADSRFKAALEIIDDNGERLDLASARTLTARQAAGRREVVFNIAGSGGQAPEFSHLVYLERSGEPPLVYFEGPTTMTEPPAPAPPSKTDATARLQLCLFKPWEPWQVLRTYCAYRFWCFLKGQQAIYLDETRKRQCPNGVQVQTRTLLVHCGC